jgi:hypothetical protein
MVSILDGSQPEKEFAQANNASQRTIARYRNQPDGLPYFEWCGRIYIPVEEARRWLESRVHRPNRRRVAA